MTNEYKEKIVNLATGEVSWRDLSDDEIAFHQAAKNKAIFEQEELAKTEAKKAAAEAKLLALGLDLDDLRALGL